MAHASDAYAGLASVNGSALAYVAVPGEVNTVALSFTPNAFTLTDTTAVIAAGIGCAPVTTHQVTCPTANNLTPSAAVDVGNMNDVVSLASVPSSVGGEISGGDGDDSLTGGPGPDRIAAGPGNDTVNGAAGDDITFSGTGADTSMGGPGTDLVTYSARDLAGSTNTLAVTVSLDGDPNDGNSDDGPPGKRDNVATDVENLQGSAGPDTLTGDAADNTIDGYADDDVLNGGGGADLLTDGGGGSETMNGGEGDDLLQGGGKPTP